MPWGNDPIIGRAPAPKASGGVKPLTAAQQIEKDQESAKRAASDQHAQERAWEVLRTTQEALEKINKNSTGVSAFFTKNLPFTEAGSLQQTIRGITSPIAIAELSRMRQESPTGGAMGNISDRDLIILQSVHGSLETAQKPEDLRKSLHKVQDVYSKITGTVPPHMDELLRSMGRTAQRMPGSEGGITAPLSPAQTSMPAPSRPTPSRTQGPTDAQLQDIYTKAHR